jgi:hypothetical protein
MVKRPEDYEYSGHRAYLGLDRTGLVDAEPVLRHFGASKKRAVEVYMRFVDASLREKSKDDYYRASEGRLLGSEEFIGEIRHRVADQYPISLPVTAVAYRAGTDADQGCEWNCARGSSPT